MSAFRRWWRDWGEFMPLFVIALGFAITAFVVWLNREPTDVPLDKMDAVLGMVTWMFFASIARQSSSETRELRDEVRALRDELRRRP